MADRCRFQVGDRVVFYQRHGTSVRPSGADGSQEPWWAHQLGELCVVESAGDDVARTGYYVKPVKPLHEEDLYGESFNVWEDELSPAPESSVTYEVSVVDGKTVVEAVTTVVSRVRMTISGSGRSDVEVDAVADAAQVWEAFEEAWQQDEALMFKYLSAMEKCGVVLRG